MNKFEKYLLSIFLYIVVFGMCYLVAELLDMDVMPIIAATALWGTIQNEVKSNNSKE